MGDLPLLGLSGGLLAVVQASGRHVPGWAWALYFSVASSVGCFSALWFRHLSRTVFNRHPPCSPVSLWMMVALLRPLETLWRLLTAPLRCKPDLLILGEVRCGTTTLAGHLSRFAGAHGPFCPWRIDFADGKESFYMVGHYCGLVHPVFYRMCFPLVFARWWARLRGKPFFCYDACAQYLTAPWVPRLMKMASPDARFVVCMRSPAEQNVSWWRFEHGSIQLGDALGLGRRWLPDRHPPASLSEALQRGLTAESQEMWARAEALPNTWVLPDWALTWPGGQLGAMAHLGDYAGNIRRWQRHFDKERFCVVELKQLSAESLPATLRRMAVLLPERCRPRDAELAAARPLHANASSALGPPPSEGEIAAVRRHYSTSRAAVEQLTGDQYPHWV
eukprot:TRINITY_DN4549_c0_g1_i4.p1 TRINITY_DN4549_c0_g1~~TRINITY_DN4549_c0_g1_i4.p1  ORF type:complete len:407 (+),score=76.17 TRINITY_DN4549_c0_g1_i4:51-1223(+)